MQIYTLVHLNRDNSFSYGINVLSAYTKLSYLKQYYIFLFIYYKCIPSTPHSYNLYVHLYLLKLGKTPAVLLFSLGTVISAHYP